MDRNSESGFKLETAQMRADHKCSLVNFERRFDLLILLRAENEASQTYVDENRLRIRVASNRAPKSYKIKLDQIKYILFNLNQNN